MKRFDFGQAPARLMHFLLLAVAATQVNADPIVSTIPAIDPSAGWGGFWIGAYELAPDNPNTGPDGFDRFTVAQSFHTDFAYANVTAAVALGGRGNVTFSVVAGGPTGATLASIDVYVQSNLAVYDLAFSDLSLADDSVYWLVATSNDVAYGAGSPNCCSGSLAIWSAVADDGGANVGPAAYKQNSGQWVFRDSMAFAVSGTIVGNPLPDAQTPWLVSEPGSLQLVGAAAVALALSSRRQTGSVTTRRAPSAPRRG